MRIQGLRFSDFVYSSPGNKQVLTLFCNGSQKEGGLASESQLKSKRHLRTSAPRNSGESRISQLLEKQLPLNFVLLVAFMQELVDRY